MQLGPYQVVKEVARGGMGVVYEALSPSGEQVALKVVLDAAQDPQLIQRFQREIRVLETLQHPGILRLRDQGVDKGQTYLVMDYLPGQSLEQLVVERGPLPEAHALELAHAMATALAYAHARGVIHRDLKPENVILRGDQPVIVDFGLARSLAPDASRLTETGSVLGSPSYMAPEQAKGEAVGPLSDVYGLGATLFYLLTGKPPFEGRSVLAILQRVVNGTPPALSTLRPDVRPEVARSIERCMAKTPGERYLTAEVLAEDLADLKARPSTANTERAVAAGALGLAAIAALACALVWFNVGEAPSQPRAVDPRTPAGKPSTPPTKPPTPAAPSVASLDPSEALSVLTAYLAEVPGDPDALCDRGAALIELGRHQDALDDLERALRLAPDRADALSFGGFAKLHLGRTGEGFADCQRAHELAPDDPLFLLNLGHAYQAQNETEQAINYYSRAIDLDPALTKAYMARGALLQHSGRLREAIRDFDTSLAHDEFALVRFSRAEAHLGLGAYDEALTDLDRVIEAEPSWAKAHYSRGIALGGLQRFEEAVTTLRRAQSLGLPPGVNEHSAKAVAQASRMIPRLERAFEHSHQGAQAYKRGDLAAALEQFDRALELDPEQIPALIGRADTKGLLGQFVEAIDDLSAAIQLNPRLTHLYKVRANLLWELGRTEEALADFGVGIGLEPNNPVRHADRGELYVILQRADEAIVDFNRALELDPNFAAALHGRGYAWTLKGEFAEALRDLSRSTELQPGEPGYWSNLGVCLHRLKRARDSLDAFDRALALPLSSAQREEIEGLRAEAQDELK